MKKLAVTLSIAALATGAWAQGFVTIANSTILTKTNALAGGGASGNTTTVASGFYYDVLTAPSTVSTIDSSLQGLTAAGWTDTGITAINSVGGLGAGKISSVNAVDTSGHWASGNFQSAVVIGWSANLGTSWSAVQAELAGAHFTGSNWVGGTLTVGGVLGVSTIAVGNPGSSSGSALALFSSTSNAQLTTPISTSMNLFVITPVPEPATMALVGLGAASLVIFRRRK